MLERHPRKFLVPLALILLGVCGMAQSPTTTSSDTTEPEDTSEARPLAGKVVQLRLSTSDLTDGVKLRAMRQLVKRANEEEAEALVFQLNTKTGYDPDLAALLLDAMQEVSIPTYAFVDPSALGAGALLALSCDVIYTKSAGVIGGAKPDSEVDDKGGVDEAATAQEISTIKAQLRS